MRPNLINRLKEEWNNLDPVDPLRGLLSDAIDALAEQPAHQQELEHDEHGPECSPEEFLLRGILASELKCWHRLTEDEAQNLVAFVQNMPPKPAQQEPVAAAKKDAVFEASIEFIGTLTGMKPPPIEVAPPEILKPFRDFTEKVCLIFAAPQPAQQEPVAWFELLREARDNCKASIVEEGISASRKEYRIDLEARLTAALNISPPASKPLTDEEIERCMKQAYATVQGRNLEHAFARAIEAAHGIKGDT